VTLPAPQRNPRREIRLLLAAGLAGAAVMVLELTAARALAPGFGTSVITWTNVIGVVLLALAIGSAVGGTLADRLPRSRVLGGVLLVAAALIVPVPFLITPLQDFLLPAPRPLAPDVTVPGMGLRVLATTALLFAPPVLLMGMVSPFVARLVKDLGVPSGQAAGRTYAVATFGSLAGTYLPAHLTLEWVGVRATIFLAAGILGLAAALLLFWRGDPSRPAASDAVTAN
jgi:MFS family permease